MSFYGNLFLRLKDLQEVAKQMSFTQKDCPDADCVDYTTIVAGAPAPDAIRVPKKLVFKYDDTNKTLTISREECLVSEKEGSV